MERKGLTKWNESEDQLLLELVLQQGEKHWKRTAQQLQNEFCAFNKTGKQCRERWFSQLNPAKKNYPWSKEETLALYRLHQDCGNQWICISKQLTGRNDTAIKNHFYCELRKFIKAFNKNKPACERILRSMKSLSRDREITIRMLEFHGKHDARSSDLGTTEPKDTLESGVVFNWDAYSCHTWQSSTTATTSLVILPIPTPGGTAPVKWFLTS